MKMCEVWKRFCAKASKWVWVRSFITCECGLCRGMLKWQKMGRGCVTLSPGIPWKLRFLRSPHPFPKRPHFVNFLSGNFLAKNWARLIGTFFFLRFHQRNGVLKKVYPFPSPFPFPPPPLPGTSLPPPLDLENGKIFRSIHQAKSQPLVGQSQLECLQSLGNS